MDSYLYAIHGNTVVSKILDFGDEFIKTLLEKTTNNFCVDVLKSWLFVLISYISNVQSSYKVTPSPVWNNSKIRLVRKKYWYEKGVINTVSEFVDDIGYFLSKKMFENKFNINHICTMQHDSIKCTIARFLRLSSFTKELHCYTFIPVIPL